MGGASHLLAKAGGWDVVTGSPDPAPAGTNDEEEAEDAAVPEEVVVEQVLIVDGRIQLGIRLIPVGAAKGLGEAAGEEPVGMLPGDANNESALNCGLGAVVTAVLADATGIACAE